MFLRSKSKKNNHLGSIFKVLYFVGKIDRPPECNCKTSYFAGKKTNVRLGTCIVFFKQIKKSVV